ncbi:VOC family protein [Cronobacter dublinensis]|uniref:VOC family protein n=1 Tax=Cronobacter dublinensis TaxID=413497 RepID=UPI0013761389|nr:VOC family protein [Cronobacter dublinensis]EKY3089387.1 drug:proton antiporter [Cronobacter dublinensis]ELQ6230311.1 drug:proton antiporter [Cronobacter dublinensis]ELY4007421.1 drug:proton antiporter [Cronobacter dublinensis]ELY4408766.1 drug:proton antiporter [Cronobacter dublinensis]ELY5821075.1 drug:proton antiporter [Cronobacter dublinensis]
MLTADMSILYVHNVLKSVEFYADLLGAQPVEKQPTFALFVLDNGFKLGLWSCYTVEPVVNPRAPVPAGEIVFKVQAREEVDHFYALWCMERQATVIQSPVELDFGYTFAVVDPDGHRLRVCFLNPEP